MAIQALFVQVRELTIRTADGQTKKTETLSTIYWKVFRFNIETLKNSKKPIVNHEL